MLRSGFDPRSSEAMRKKLDTRFPAVSFNAPTCSLLRYFDKVWLLFGFDWWVVLCLRNFALCCDLGFFCGLFSTSVSIWRCFVAESVLYDSRMLNYVHVCSIIGVLGFVYTS